MTTPISDGRMQQIVSTHAQLHEGSDDAWLALVPEVVAESIVRGRGGITSCELADGTQLRVDPYFGEPFGWFVTRPASDEAAAS
jgi:hypothetical protein